MIDDCLPTGLDLSEVVHSLSHDPMQLALKIMELGHDPSKGFKPFGAVITKDGVVLATGLNTCSADRDPTAHAEINAIRAAARQLGSLDLGSCSLYCSAQPCPMCRAAAFHAGIRTIVYASPWCDYQDLFPDQACHDAISQLPDPVAKHSLLHHQQSLDLWTQYRDFMSTTDNETLTS